MRRASCSIGVSRTAERMSFSDIDARAVVWFAAAVSAVVFCRRRFGRAVRRDKRRAFTPADRSTLLSRAGGRCEHVAWWGHRCRADAEHADHVWPHSRGGPTVLSNGAALCAWHNLRKSDRVPSRFYVARIERSRQGYYPAGVDPTIRW